MTESDWLSSTDPAAMLRWLNGYAVPIGYDHPIDRKLRLFACTCCRQLGSFGTAVDQWEEKGHPAGMTDLEWAQGWSLDPTRVQEWYLDPTLAVRAALLREIFGNPFQRLPRRNGGTLVDNDNYILPWSTSPTVLSLAQAIYDNRRFEDMPILGDVLEEAGCVDKAILRHCRGEERCRLCTCTTGTWTQSLCSVCCKDPETLGKATGWAPLRGPHVRGCHVVDLILGKE